MSPDSAESSSALPFADHPRRASAKASTDSEGLPFRSEAPADDSAGGRRDPRSGSAGGRSPLPSDEEASSEAGDAGPSPDAVPKRWRGRTGDAHFPAPDSDASDFDVEHDGGPPRTVVILCASPRLLRPFGLVSAFARWRSRQARQRDSLHGSDPVGGSDPFRGSDPLCGSASLSGSPSLSRSDPLGGRPSLMPLLRGLTERHDLSCQIDRQRDINDRLSARLKQLQAQVAVARGLQQQP
jgi:hypothetical protein